MLTTAKGRPLFQEGSGVAGLVSLWQRCLRRGAQLSPHPSSCDSQQGKAVQKSHILLASGMFFRKPCSQRRDARSNPCYCYLKVTGSPDSRREEAGVFPLLFC